MEQEKTFVLDEKLEKDIKDCKKNAEVLEKILTMLVKGFAPEY
jgi:hypothetical protein